MPRRASLGVQAANCTGSAAVGARGTQAEMALLRPTSVRIAAASRSRLLPHHVWVGGSAPERLELT
jgi:hypothetical protein